MQATWVHLAYMIASVLFIFGLKRLSSVRTARQGNWLASAAMLVAIVATLIDANVLDYSLLFIGLLVGALIGAWAALKVEMEGMPQMVAIFNGMGGLASLLVALSFFYEEMVATKHATVQTTAQLMSPEGGVSVFLSILIGAITASGSVIAWGKLQGVSWIPDQPVQFKGQHALNLGLVLAVFGLAYGMVFSFTSTSALVLFLLVLVVVCLALGVLLVIPIGGADMPVVISLLNSYSGLAAAMTGFIIQNNLLIISGSLVGASGLILTNIMCKAMNRSLANVLFGGFGAETASGSDGRGAREYFSVKPIEAEEVAMLLDSVNSVIIVPGYGMAVAQAQHAVRDLCDLLEKRGCEVQFAIHPVAGRMPGHMNVLLAEANIPYDKLREMDDINNEFKNTEVAIVLGANDVVNPDALDKKESPIYGMPILHVHEAQQVIVIKRSLSPGFAKIANPLFDMPNTRMFFSDGRKAVESAIQELKAL